MPNHPMGELEAFLLDQSQALPLALVAQHHLEAWVLTRLPHGHPQRTALRPKQIQAALKHELTKRHLAALLQVWNKAGIEVLVFKGFAFAEYVFAQPSARHYNDVDVLIQHHQAAEAVRIARAHGWHELFNLEQSHLKYDHEYSHLFSRDRSVRIDLHLEFLQTERQDTRRQTLRQKIWQDARTLPLGETHLRVPRDTDLAIVALLNRRWGNWWARHPNDFIGLLALKEKGMRREDLQTRASVLGCSRSIDLALQTCDPWRGILDLTTPTRARRWRNDWACRHELGFYILEYTQARLRAVPQRLWLLTKVLPVLHKARKRLRLGAGIATLVAAFDTVPQRNAKLTQAQLEQLQLAVLWATRVFGPRRNPCVPRALVLFELLSRAGHAASFKSGVRRHNSILEGHAWIEMNGWPLEIMGDLNAPNDFKENFSFDNQAQRHLQTQLQQERRVAQEQP